MSDTFTTLKDMATAIQEAQYAEQEGDATNWRITHTFGKLGQQWLKLSFDHKFCNGLDTMKLFKENYALLSSFLLSDCNVNQPLMKGGYCFAEKSGAPGGVYYVGSPSIDAKTVVRDFYDQLADEFYLPIDMAHEFGEPVLLNYSFDPRISFEENWDQVRRIKKNEGKFLCLNDAWKEYIEPKKAWVSCMKLDLDGPFTFTHYDYDPVHLQGLGVCITKSGSYWSFDFYRTPEMERYFVEKYDLMLMT